MEFGFGCLYLALADKFADVGDGYGRKDAQDGDDNQELNKSKPLLAITELLDKPLPSSPPFTFLFSVLNSTADLNSLQSPKSRLWGRKIVMPLPLG